MALVSFFLGLVPKQQTYTETNKLLICRRLLDRYHLLFSYKRTSTGSNQVPLGFCERFFSTSSKWTQHHRSPYSTEYVCFLLIWFKNIFKISQIKFPIALDLSGPKAASGIAIIVRVPMLVKKFGLSRLRFGMMEKGFPCRIRCAFLW